MNGEFPAYRNQPFTCFAESGDRRVDPLPGKAWRASMHAPNYRCCSTGPAFTLVELLVVAAIIATLAALLLTAIGSVKLKANRTQCLSNIKQLALGSFMYAQDNSRHAGYETAAFPGGNWVDLWPWETDKAYNNLYTGQPFAVSPNQMGRCTIARHGSRSASRAPRNFSTGGKPPGAINMGMADGHVELVQLEGLWKCCWHRDWQPPVTRPK
jgi:prepilin-type processing-associated H-X9-DG protein